MKMAFISNQTCLDRKELYRSVDLSALLSGTSFPPLGKKSSRSRACAVLQLSQNLGHDAAAGAAIHVQHVKSINKKL